MSIGTYEGESVKGTFIHVGRAHYRQTALPGGREVDEIMIMCDAPVGEFAVRWFDYGSIGGGGNKEPFPQLGMFYQSWAWFEICSAFFEWLATNNDIRLSPESVVEKLLELGFEDTTPEVDPRTGEGPGKREVGQSLPESRSSG